MAPQMNPQMIGKVTTTFVFLQQTKTCLRQTTLKVIPASPSAKKNALRISTAVPSSGTTVGGMAPNANY